MANKIEGWVTPWGIDDAIRNNVEVVLRRNELKPLGTIRAILIETDERVFTESEVRAMLMRVYKACRKPFSAEHVKLLRAEGFEVETDVPFSDPA